MRGESFLPLVASGAAHRRPAAALVLADGARFEGEAMGYWGGSAASGVPGDSGASGAPASASGEVVFNTVLSGYQEVITDPSYAGQVICFTYPHIGNYGVNAQDNESRRPWCRGVIVRDLARRPSSWRATESLEAFLVRHRVPGLTGIDTRRLTKHLRSEGSLPGAFAPLEGPHAVSEAELAGAAASARSTDGVDLVSSVTTPTPYRVGEGPLHVVAYDYGIKSTILRQLGEWATVDVVPAATSADEVMEMRPDGVFLSNGPGDPAALAAVTAPVADLLGRVPIFGICLGHQILATALGGRTYKLPFGHHGGNHPVGRTGTHEVEITSQNHNYAVDADSLPGVEITHVNLNDGVVEGMASRELGAVSIQYHPEAGPGPHDSRYLFELFRAMAAGERV